MASLGFLPQNFHVDFDYFLFKKNMFILIIFASNSKMKKKLSLWTVEKMKKKSKKITLSEKNLLKITTTNNKNTYFLPSHDGRFILVEMFSWYSQLFIFSLRVIFFSIQFFSFKKRFIGSFINF